MKKFLFALTAAAVALLSSCAKEETPAAVESNSGAFTITARIDNDATKTHYVEGASSASLYWNSGDQFKLIVYKDDEGKAANFYSFQAANDASGSEATFTIVSGSMDLTNYKPAGYAVYPKALATGGVKDAYTVTLSGEYTVASGTDLSKVAVPMIGVPTDAADANTYVFSPAVGVLKVQLTNVPASARKVVLKAVDADNVSGVFPLDAANGFRMADAGSAGHTVTVNFPSQTEGSDIAVYMPIPVGSISAGAVFELQDNAGTALHATPPTVKAINVAKGQLIPVKAINITSDWTTLGTGKFVDNFLWGKMVAEGTVDADTPGYVEVIIQQNNTDNTQYRVANPYGTAAEQFGIAASSPDSYLTFTIADNESVTFDTHNTGIEINYLAKKVTKLVSGGSKSLLLAGTKTNPEVVQLAPVYKATDNSDGNQYTKTGASNMIHIVFPSALSSYEPTISNIGDDPEAMVSSFNLACASPRTRLILSQQNAIQLAYSASYSGKEQANYTSDQTSLNWNSKIDASGKWYLNWFVMDSGDNDCYRQGSISFYAATSADLAKVCGTWGTIPVVIEKSNDPTKGSVMITQISTYSATYGVYGYTYVNSSKNRQELVFDNGQLFADYDTGLAHATYGAMDKLSYQELNYGKTKWETISSWNIPDDPGNRIYNDGYIVLRPTNDSARVVNLFEGYGNSGNDYGGFLYDCYGLLKQ